MRTDREIQKYLEFIDACGPDAAVLEAKLRDKAGLMRCPECRKWTARIQCPIYEAEFPDVPVVVCENEKCDYWE